MFENSFVILLRNFFVCLILPSSLFVMKRDLRDPTLPFVKTVGPEVFSGNFDCAGEQTYRSHLGMGFLWSYLSVPLDLSTSLDMRKRSDVMTISKKRKEVPVSLSTPE